MLKKMMFLLVMLLMPLGIAETIKSCSDANTMYIIKDKNLTIDSNTSTFIISEYVDCPAGCANGECKPIQSSMPIEIYIMFSVAGLVFMIFSFFSKEGWGLVIKWITFIIFVMLGVSSFNLNRVYCENTSSSWTCFVHQYKASNLAYLWFGLALVMFIYAFISNIAQPAQQIADKV
jgi:hypothetical protein